MDRNIAQSLSDIAITLAMRPEHERGGAKIGHLPPEHWEEVRRRLQIVYRRATGDTQATLVVGKGRP